MSLDEMIDKLDGAQFAIRYYHEGGSAHLAEAGEIMTWDLLDVVVSRANELIRGEGPLMQYLSDSFGGDVPEIQAVSIVLMTSISVIKKEEVC